MKIINALVGAAAFCFFDFPEFYRQPAMIPTKSRSCKSKKNPSSSKKINTNHKRKICAKRRARKTI